MSTQGRLAEIEQQFADGAFDYMNENEYWAVGWLIEEVKRLRNDPEMVERGEYPKP